MSNCQYCGKFHLTNHEREVHEACYCHKPESLNMRIKKNNYPEPKRGEDKKPSMIPGRKYTGNNL